MCVFVTSQTNIFVPGPVQIKRDQIIKTVLYISFKIFSLYILYNIVIIVFNLIFTTKFFLVQLIRTITCLKPMQWHKTVHGEYIISINLSISGLQLELSVLP